MTLKKWTFALLLSILATSCIQDEELNSEAAIDGCTGADIQLASISTSERTVILYVQRGADLSQQEVIFTLPDGATIAPNEVKSGDNEEENIYNFSEDNYQRLFTVTSEDGNQKPEYTVSIVLTELPTSYHFEQLVDDTNDYDTFYEETAPTSSSDSRKILQWESGNRGFALTSMATDRTGYPTMQVSDGYIGNCVKLETKDTGSFGAMVNMYIAAGNLFIGNFDLTNALTAPLQATQFGFQFFERPVRLTGYYKYKAGSVYTESGVTNSSKTDRFDIYAILYEAAAVEDGTGMLNGANALTSSALVAYAQIDEADAVETDTWTAFNLPFRTVNGKSIDDDKLEAGDYKLSIVFSSSIDGGNFNGAVGSTLYIDEVELECE